MKQLILVTLLTGAILFWGPTAIAQNARPAKPLVRLGTVVIQKEVMLDGGKQLQAGTYDVRLTGQESRPATGTIPGVERQAEFVRRSFYRRGMVAGTAVVNVVPASDVSKIRDQAGKVPKSGTQTVEITEHDFLRIWFNRSETHYLIYLRSS